jgi:hypothetical protein
MPKSGDSKDAKVDEEKRPWGLWMQELSDKVQHADVWSMESWGWPANCDSNLGDMIAVKSVGQVAMEVLRTWIDGLV